MGRFVDVDDLARVNPNLNLSDPKIRESLEALIEHAEATALVTAPCISDPGFAGGGALKALLVGAVSRWHSLGDGITSQESAGPFSRTIDSTAKRLLFWPSEIKGLRGLCGKVRGRAFHVDMS